jgi:threonine/homoserine/homoserine lactone efflux protein
MSTLLVEIVPLALGAAISPVIFLLQLTTLTGPRPTARGSVLAAGAAAALIVVSTIGVLVGDTGFSTRDTLQAVINIAFGALLAAVGLRALVRPPKPREPKSSARRPSLRGSFLAGVGGMASNVTTFALYIPALALIAGSGLSLRQQGIAALIILVITLIGGVGAARARGRCPRRIDPPSAPARRMDEGEQPMDPGRLGPRLRCLAPRQGRGWIVMRGSPSLRRDHRGSKRLRRRTRVARGSSEGTRRWAGLGRFSSSGLLSVVRRGVKRPDRRDDRGIAYEPVDRAQSPPPRLEGAR